MCQRRRQESNLLFVGLQPTAWPSGPGVRENQEPAVGLEPTRAALQERCPTCRASLASSEYGTRTHVTGFKDPSTALASQQPVLVSNQLNRGSEPQSPPRAWPEQSILQSQRWDSNPLVPPYESGARSVEHRRHLQGGRWESNPHTPGSRCLFGFGHSIPGRSRTCMDLRLRRAACFRHTPGITTSTSTRNRTWTSTFGGSRDVPFTTEASICRGWTRTIIGRVHVPTLLTLNDSAGE